MRLVLLEVINPADIAINFMAGLLPGWWVAREDWRPHSACVSEDVWDRVLADNGFSGNDLIIRDYKSEQCHITSVIVSTAQDKQKQVDDSKSKSGRLVLMIDAQSDKQEEQKQLADLVRTHLDLGGDRKTEICTLSLKSLSGSPVSLTKDDILVCLAEVNNRPLLSSLTEESFKDLQNVIQQAHNLLWVTAASTNNDHYPDYSVLQGFLRSIRAEQADSHIVSLAIEDEMDTKSYAYFVSKAFRSTFDSTASKELEYVIRDGLIHTGRAIENVAGNETLRSLVSPQLKQKTWAQGPALQLSVIPNDKSTTLRFVEDDTFKTDMASHEVEVETKAWGLKYRDLKGDSLDGHDELLQADCAGIVTRVGPGSDSSIQSGDRVCTASLGGLHKYSRTQEKTIVKIPDDMSYETAVSTLLPTMTGYHALVDIGRLKKGDKVLIHSAAGRLGQIAAQIAKCKARMFLLLSRLPKRSNS